MRYRTERARTDGSDLTWAPAPTAGHLDSQQAKARAWQSPILRNFTSLTLSHAAERFISVFGSIYARRVLGVAAIGQVAWTGAALGYISLVVNPGLQWVAKREVSREPAKAAQYISFLFVLQGMLAVSAYAVILCVYGLQWRGPAISLLLALQGISLLTQPFDLQWLLQAHERMVPLAALSFCSSALQTAALFVLIHDPSHVTRFVLLPYPFRVASLAFIVWYSVRCGFLQLSELRVTMRGAGRVLRQGLPIALSSATIVLYYNFDSLLLGLLKGDAAVGLYSTAYSLMLIPTFMSNALLNTYFPLLARSVREPGGAQRVSAEFLKALVWIGFPIASIGWAVGRHVVVLLLGAKFAVSGPLFEWLCLNLSLIFFNVGYSQPLVAWSHQGALLRCTAVGAAVNVAANLWFIPRYGANGAVATTILAEIAVLIMAVSVRRQIYPLNWIAPLARVVPVCVAAAVIARFASDLVSPYLGLVLGICICAAGFVAYEWQWIRRAAPSLYRATPR